MYSCDDRWVLSHPLTVVEFTTEFLTIFDCLAVDAEFYHDRLRKLVITEVSARATSTRDPVSESFIIQHGNALPSTVYLGVSRSMCHMDRFFRVLSSRGEFPFGSYVGSKHTYELAGLPGEGDGILDRLFDEIEHE